MAISNNISDLEVSKFKESTSVPGKAGIVVLNPDGSNVGSGGGGGGAVTIADGADTNAGATTDAKVTGDTGGTVSAKLRGLNTEIGILTETAPTTDTASSGLNGRLQRIAQRLTSLIALLPASIGQKLMATSLAVTIASDQSSIPTTSAQAARVIGTITTNSGVVTASVTAYSIATVTFSGTYAGITMNFEASDDGGVTYYSVLGSLSSSTASAVTSVALATNATAMYNVTLPGITNFRVRSSAYTSGTLSVGITATADPMVFNAAVGIVGTPPFNLTQVAATNVVTGGVAGSQSVGGHTANNATQAGNPLYVGATATSAEATNATTGQNSGLVTDLAHKLINLPYSNPENIVNGVISSAMTATTSTSLVPAPAAGLRNYVTSITVSNSHATVGTDILIQDGSGGTTLWVIPAAAVYGGAAVTFPVAIRQPTTATALFAQNVTTGSNTKVSAQGYKGS